MLKFELNVAERKILANRMEELTGIHPYYTRAPLHAYEIGGYTIDRDGNLLVKPEDADQDVLLALLNEGLIRGGESIEDEGIQPEHGEYAPEDADAETDEAETEPDEVQDLDDSESDVPVDEIPLDMELAFPISQHNGVSLRNLVNLFYSRGKLIGKATGGHFHVEEGLVEELKDDRCTYAITNFINAVSSYEAQHGEALEGLKITSDKVIFTGFPIAPDHEHLTAFGHLAILMNRQAITQKRIQAKEVTDENEKYALRIWLLRLGMNGPDFKETRKLLMENLSGHAAFRTDEEARKFLAREKAKRDAIKAAKQAEQNGTSLAGEVGAPTADEPTQPGCGADTAQMLEAGA